MMDAADLFAGLGGWTAAAAEAGVRVRLAANHSPQACRWFQRNHPDVVSVCQDLGEFDWTRLPDITDGFLLASPACQGFSTTSQGERTPRQVRKHQRDRNTTWAVVAAADSQSPRCIVVENVRQMLTWRLFPAWRGCLEAMGYHVTERVINAHDYGSPQERHRAIVVASLDGPVELAPEWGEGPGAACVGDVLLDDQELPEGAWEDVSSKTPKMAHRMARAHRRSGRCLWNNVTDETERRLSQPSQTITTRSRGQLYLVDGARCRRLMPREQARLQGFPDTYRIPSAVTLASKLIGNAIDLHVASGVLAQVAA